MNWLPLQKIAHGIAIYPFTPSVLQNQLNRDNGSNHRNSGNDIRPLSVASSSQTPYEANSNRNSFSSSTSRCDSYRKQRHSTNMEDYNHLINLEVGDEVYIIEQQGQWYRGYVSTILEEGLKSNKLPIGCFPRTHIHIKEYIDIDPNLSNSLIYNHQHFNHDVWNSLISRSVMSKDLPRSLSEPYIDRRKLEQLSSIGRTGSLSNLDEESIFLGHNELENDTLPTHMPPPPLPLNRLDQSTLTGYAEPLVDEIAACITEWNSLFYTYLSQRDYQTFNTLKENVYYLLQARRQLLDQVLSREESTKLRRDVTQRMVMGNVDLNRDMIIRHPERGYLLDVINTPLSTIYQLHWKYTIYNTCKDTLSIHDINEDFDLTTMPTSLHNTANGENFKQQNINNNGNELPPQFSTPKFYHIYLNMNNLSVQNAQSGEFIELHFALYSTVYRRFITEDYIVVLNSEGIPKSNEDGGLQTLFVDLSLQDVSEGLYLVCHFVRLGSLKPNDSFYSHFGHFNGHNFLHPNRRNSIFRDSTPRYRRPFACAVLKLSIFDLQSNLTQYSMPLYSAFSESNFARLHEDIIINNSKNVFQKLQNHNLVVSLQSFHGRLREISKNNSLKLQDATHTLRIGFADVSYPNDSRNELYIRLKEGDFAQFGNSRNIQVVMCVRDNETGEVVENAISSGSGIEPMSYWESMVIYHNQHPQWNELIKIQIQDLKQWQRSHVFITIKHRSSHHNSSGSSLSNARLKGKNNYNDMHTSRGNYTFGLSATPSNGTERVIAIGFLPMFLPPFHHDLVADGDHTIVLYNYDPQLSSPQYYLDLTKWCSKSTAPINMAAQTAETKAVRPLNKSLLGIPSPTNRSFKSSSASFISSNSLNTVSAPSDNVSRINSISSQHAPVNMLTPLRDTISIVTFLCSTKFTQNKTLVKLLNWHSWLHNSEDSKSKLLSVLNQFTFVGEVEVVKFINDIFDALLNIMLYHEDEDVPINREIHDQVLTAIVWLLSIVQDRRFSNFKPGLDVYLDHRFKVQSGDSRLKKIGTFKYFVSSLTRLCENPNDSSKAKLLRSSMKVWDYLFRFIIRSRLYHQQGESLEKNKKNDERFKNDVSKLLVAITKIMSPEHPNSMIGTQTIALQHFSGVLIELQKFFSCRYVMDVTVAFVDACYHVTGKLAGFKLMFILNTVKGPIFGNSSCKTEMIQHVLRWIKVWVNCYTIIARNVIFSKKEQHNILRQDRDQQNASHSIHQTRIPKAQWIENLRLSLTIMKEVLNEIRTSAGMDLSGLTSSGLPSPAASYGSRPTSFCSVNNDNDPVNQGDCSMITKELISFVPQLLNAYKDLQRLTILAIQISDSPEDFKTSESNTFQDLRSQSRHSFGKLRERSMSVNTKSSLPSEALQETLTNQTKRSSAHVSGVATNPSIPNATVAQFDQSNSKTKFNIVLQALSTSPPIPFPCVYPFQRTKMIPSSNNPESLNDQTAMVSTGLFDLTAVFLELFYLVPHKQWIDYMKTMHQQNGLEDTANFLRKVVYTCMGILFGDDIFTLEESTLLTDNMGRHEEDKASSRRCLPFRWLNFNVVAHKIILGHILDPIKSILELPDFMPSSDAYTTMATGAEASSGMHEETIEEEVKMDHPSTLNSHGPSIEQQRSALLLWRVYFVGFLRVLGSARLDMTQFQPQTQRATYELIHNLRGEFGANTCMFLWNLAGKSSHAFISGAPDAEENSHRHSSSDYTVSDSQAFFDQGYFSDMHYKNAVSSDDIDHVYTFRGTSMSSQGTNANHSQYSARYSVRIAPTEEAPLKPINEGKQSGVETNIPFLQVDLAHFILRPMSATSLTLHDRVRTSSLSIIADIIAIELYSFGELVYVQKMIIGALDHLVMYENKGDEELASRIALEISQLLSQRLQADHREDLVSTGKRIIQSLSRFFHLLLQVRSLPADDDEYMDERIMATLRLMKFIQVIEREEIYVKYVHQLVQIHLDNQNIIEAALTLRLHSDLLGWDTSDKMAAIPELDLPAQSSFERKEKLYLTMIQYLDRGSAWEICVTICKELAYEYEHALFDYSKLSKILRRQAQFVDNINNTCRCFTGYFRVGFYGRGFPATNRNRQYIYRGLEWEKLNSFVERMQNRHPTANMLPSKIANAMSLTEEQLKEIDSTTDGKYIQITPVTPIPDEQLAPCLSNANAPESVKQYYEFNHVNKFVFTRVIAKETDASEDTSPESDFLNLWTEKIDLESEDRFPTIVKRSRIIKANSTLISPIENAVETVENKNRELVYLEKKYSAYVSRNLLPVSSTVQPVNISPFSMSLNGAVDAPVNGGIPLYKKAFLSKDYWDKNPDMRHWIQRLQEVIQDQVAIIQKCLETHDLLISNEMRPFHVTLVDFFYKNFASEIKALKERQTKEKTGYSSSTKRRSTYSSNTDSNSVYSHYLQPSNEDKRPSVTPSLNNKQNTLSMVPTSTLPTMSPISRAFSIKSPTTENSTSLINENATLSRAESLSRSLRMSLRKRPRKKSHNNLNSS